MPGVTNVPKSRSQKARKFVNEYLVDLNASAAAVRAGYAPRNAGSQAGRLMRDPRVRAEIAGAMSARSERIEVTADAVVRELAALASTSLGDFLFIDECGHLQIRLNDAALAKARALKKLEVTELKDGSRRISIELVDRIKILELLGRHVGLGRTKNSVDSSELIARINAGRDRLAAARANRPAET